MKPYRGFADMVRRRRKELGITLGKVAEGTGWTVPYVSEIERGVKQPPPADRLDRLAAVLQLDLNRLVAEAIVSRRSLEISLEGTTSSQRRLVAVLARRLEGLSDEEAEEMIRGLRKGNGEGDDDDLAF